MPRQLLLHPSLTALLALLHVGLRGYHLQDRNCEHFATYCQTGGWHSHQVQDAQAAGPTALLAKVLEASVEATLGRAATFFEDLANAPPETAAQQVGERSVFFYGDLWQNDTQFWVHAPVGHGPGAGERDGGFWGVGVPWNHVTDWTPAPHVPDSTRRVGEVFVDDQLMVYLFHEQAGWLRAKGAFSSKVLPPLPEPHPALVERAYPLEWFE